METSRCPDQLEALAALRLRESVMSAQYGNLCPRSSVRALQVQVQVPSAQCPVPVPIEIGGIGGGVELQGTNKTN